MAGDNWKPIGYGLKIWAMKKKKTLRIAYSGG